MINVVLSVLKDKLNEYLKNIGSTELDVVEFINANNSSKQL